MKPFEAVGNARIHLQKALDLDETLAEAHCTSALIKSWYELDWVGAEREFQAALALEPGLIVALLWQSLYLSAMGRHGEAVASVQRAREIEPLSASVNLYLGVAQTHAGQYDLALRQMQQSIELDPSYYRSHMFLGRNLSWLGRYDEAIVSFKKALELTPDNIESLAFLGATLAAKGDRKGALKLAKELMTAEARSEPAVLLAVIYARLGLSKELFESLERAVVTKSTPIYIVLLSEEFRPFRADPRYHAFLGSIGLSHLASN
jgi:tetratricopeptide (TPR) repeat protein